VRGSGARAGFLLPAPAGGATHTTGFLEEEPMGTHARIENGFISIDTAAWLEQRTGGPLDDLTGDLRTRAARHHPQADPATPAATDQGGDDGRRDDGPVPLDGYVWRQAVLAWCAARGHGSPDPTDPLAGPLVIAHEGTRLDREVWLALAETPDGCRIAVVQCNDDVPVVYADAVGDTGDWFDADTVQIGCPNGHGWLWRTGRELLTADGSFTTLTVVFGPNLDAPFSRCRVCEAFDAGRRAAPCGCDGVAWIVCPVCSGRCDVHLPPR
jgi:hypothetical protein